MTTPQPGTFKPAANTVEVLRAIINFGLRFIIRLVELQAPAPVGLHVRSKGCRLVASSKPIPFQMHRQCIGLPTVQPCAELN